MKKRMYKKNKNRSPRVAKPWKVIVVKNRKRGIK